MPRVVTFRVAGIPAPKGSAKGFLHRATGRVIVHADNRASLKAWEASVRYAAQQQAGDVFFMDAVRVDLAFFFTRPKSVSATRRPLMTTRPDVDKLARAAIDSLIGTLITDDALIVALSASKQYAQAGDGPHALVTLRDARLDAAEGRIAV